MSESAAAAAEADATGSRVLVFEEDPRVQGVLETYLRGGGHSVKFVDTTDDLMSKVEESPPQVVLTHLLLPDADGLDVCARLRAGDPSGSMKILLTSFLSCEDWALDAGADLYLRRPVSEQRLLTAIRKLSGGPPAAGGRPKMDEGAASAASGEEVTR